ncbi:MAG: SNF2 helicase associated domain-containing protein [Clostridia bacterium]|nr:SNF2 helicase associated domain-containing protein [Clostridia bacterium]
MFTIPQAREAICNTAYFARGRAYAESGRVIRHDVVRDGSMLIGYGTVRGHGDHYSVGFSYDEETQRFTQCSCTCPAFDRARFGCKHVAALMIAVCEGDKRRSRKTDKAQREAGILQQAESTISRIERELREMGILAGSRRGAEQETQERERIRRQEEEMRRQAEQEQRDSFVRGLLDGAQASRAAQMPGAKSEQVCLVPLLSLREEGVVMELRIGRRRLYLLRSADAFAQAMESRATAVYGKELTLRHHEGEFAEEDLPLLRHVLALTDGAPKLAAGQLLLQKGQLDQTMRLLIGRRAEMRTADGQIIPARIVEGVPQLEAGLSREAGGVMLRLNDARAARGMSGAYFFGDGEILCAFGDDYDRVSGLLEVYEAYPGGLLLGQEQLPAVCARVLAPAAQTLAVREGAEILRENTPMPIIVRYYADMEEHGGQTAGGEECLTCRVEYEYAGQRVKPGAEAPHIRRDEDAEARALAAAKAVFPEEIAAGVYGFNGSDEEQFTLLSERLPELSAFGEVLVAQRLTQMHVKQKRPISFGLSARQEELVLKSDLGGLSQEDLRAAYAAYRQKRRFVRLKDGIFLSGDALEQAAKTGEMLDNLDVTADQVRDGAAIPASRALYIEEALEKRGEMTLQTSAEMRDWMDRLRQAQQTDIEPPQGLRAQLRGYQQTGLSWLCALGEAGFGGILADDMGLGKTVQALAMLLHDKESGMRVRALVVCPASLQLNWLSEAERFAPGLKTVALLGDADQRRQTIEGLKREDAPELLIASYDQVRRDVQHYDGAALSHVLLDEAQYIKNAASQAARAVKSLKAERRYAMTGTPVENRLSELWSIFDFLMPGYLYSYKKFRERFELPIVHDADEETRAQLRMLAAPFILRRMKKDVLDDLPDKTETLMTSEMTPAQRKLYASYAAKLIDEADGGLADAQSRMKILAGLTRLRQICCDPRLCVEDYTGGSGKLDQCIELVREMNEGGHRMLLFSQFTTMLATLREALEREGFTVLELTGETGKRERMQLAKRFNEGEGDVFLISLKAGGTGLNLTGADVVIHYDPWWNTAAQNQATDRAYRIGQTRGVQVISLIAAGTVEERILRLQQAKSALSDGVLEGGENLFTLDAEAFRQILKG